LMLPNPLVALHPKVSFLHIDGLLGQNRFACGQLGPSATQTAKEPAQNEKIHKEEQRAHDKPGKYAFALIHPLVPPRHYHRGLASTRNCAWSFRKMRG